MALWGSPFRFTNMKCFKNIFVRSVRIIFFVMEKGFQLNAAREFQGDQGTIEEAMFYTIRLLHSSQVLLPAGFHNNALQGLTQATPSKGIQNYLKSR